MTEENGTAPSMAAFNVTKIKDVISSTLRNWPWMVVSIVFFAGFSLLYALRSNPTYTRNASVVINENEGGSTTADLSGLSDLGIFTSNTNIYDEVNKFKSPDVYKEVISRLRLDITYFSEGSLRNKFLYGKEIPVNVVCPTVSKHDSFSFKIDIKDNDTFELTGGKASKKAEPYKIKDGTYRFGQTINTPVGKIVIDKTAEFANITSEEKPTIIISKTPEEIVLKSLSASLAVTFKKNEGNTINFAINDLSPERAEDILNTVIDVYNERWIKAKNEISLSTTKFIDQRLRVIESELGNVDRNISTYQSENHIPDVKEAATLYMKEFQETEGDILKLNNQLAMTRYMRDFVVNEAKSNRIIPANTGIENRGIEEQISEYNKKTIERSQMASGGSANHPIVAELDAQLADMRTSIVHSLNNQMASLSASIGNMQSSMSRTSANIAATPRQAKDLLSAERQQKVKESLYLFLLQKREENELSQAFSAYNTEVIAKPNGSIYPTKPKKKVIVAIGLMLGLIVPFVVEYIRMMMNDKVRTRQDLENLATPLLGEMPLCKFGKDNKDHKQVVVRSGERDLVNESFRLLRTNLSFVTGEKDACEVVMLTSFVPGSGKTFIAMNMGASFALKEKKVLVIDCDLRRATTSTFIGSPHRGLTDYLVGRVHNLSEIIKPYDSVLGLSVLPVGTTPPNPTELLESRKFAETIEALRAEYDYIFIDCPPIEMMADAQIINHVCDRTVFVIRSGKIRMKMAKEVDRLAEAKKFKNMAIVLNATEISSSGYGSYHSYGGYGYAEKQK